MLIEVFSVFDMQTNAFSNPFYCQTKGLALRSFMDAVSDPQSPFHRHPDDFALFRVATFDNVECKFENLNVPERVALARELLVDLS